MQLSSGDPKGLFGSVDVATGQFVVSAIAVVVYVIILIILLWPLLFRVIEKLLPARAGAAVEHLSEELHQDLDTDDDGHPLATSHAPEIELPEPSHEGETMTIVVGFSATAPGRAALTTAVTEAQLRQQPLLVINSSRGDALRRPQLRPAGGLGLGADHPRRGRGRLQRAPGAARQGPVRGDPGRASSEVGATLCVIGLRRRSAGRQDAAGQQRPPDPDGVARARCCRCDPTSTRRADHGGPSRRPPPISSTSTARPGQHPRPVAQLRPAGPVRRRRRHREVLRGQRPAEDRRCPSTTIRTVGCS